MTDEGQAGPGTPVPPAEPPATLRRHDALAHLQEARWFACALGTADSLESAKRSLEAVRERLAEHPGWATYVEWVFTTRTQPAARELEAAERQADEECAQAMSRAQELDAHLKRQESTVGEELAQIVTPIQEAVEECSDACSQLGIPHSQEKQLTAGAVRDALEATAPNLEAVSGERGEAPAEEEPVAGPGVGLAVIPGFMLAVGIGILTGILQLRDLQRFDRILPLCLFATLGPSILVLAGSLIAGIHRVIYGVTTPMPTHTRRLPRFATLAGWCAAYAAVLLAEVTVEAYALHFLFLELARDRRLLGGEVESLSLLLCFVCGAIISLPYVLAKAVSARNEIDRQRRLANQRSTLAERRLAHLRSAGAQRALKAAGRLDSLRQRRQELADTLEALQTERSALFPVVPSETTRLRCEYAAAAAAGEAAFLQTLVLRFLHAIDPLPTTGTEPGTAAGQPSPAAPASFNGRTKDDRKEAAR